ncbi:hypothetical protein QE359_001464 [Curtobacterium sp. SORGH_AS776]|jgi:hypothetical protein|nr:hypothetical protein [Curtobacterium sp. SORGH_AS_0776]
MTRPPAPSSIAEHEALRALLRAAKQAELAAIGPTRRIAFRNTRSLIGAAHELGFTHAVLAAMLEVTEGSVRTRTGPPLPILPSAFLALTPAAFGSPWAVGVRGPSHGSERQVNMLVLLRWYLLHAGSTDPS